MGDKKDKKSKKDKKQKKQQDSDEEEDAADKTLDGDYKTRLFVSPIADPLASDKLSKKLLKLTKRAMKDKLVKRGVKETVKAVRKGQKGVVIIAADISPIDVLSHLPILCEDKSIPYMYVKSRAEIGEACKTKRPTSCVMICKPDKKKHEESNESYEECSSKILDLNSYIKN